MRYAAAFVLILSLSAVGLVPRPQPPQSAPPTERIPCGGNNAYPRWTPWVDPAPDPADLSTDGIGGTTVVDDQGVVHWAGLRTITDAQGGHRQAIYTRQAAFGERRINGLIPAQVVADSVYAGGVSYISNVCIARQNNALYILWSDTYEPNKHGIFFATGNSDGWSMGGRLTPDSVNLSSFELVAGANDFTIYAVYGVSSNTRALFTWSPGSSWSQLAGPGEVTGNPDGVDLGPLQARAFPKRGGGYHMWYSRVFGWAQFGHMYYTTGSGFVPMTDELFPTNVLDASDGSLHIAQGYYYRVGINGTPVNVGTQLGLFAEDVRGQIHTTSCSRIFNPNPTQLNPVWTAGSQNYVLPSGKGGSSAFYAFKDRTFMVASGGSMVRSLEYGVGARDPEALVPAVPGGSADVISGNLHLRIPLFSAAGLDGGQSWALTYNSLDRHKALVAPGWRLSCEMYLSGQVLHMPDGQNVPFTAFGETNPSTGLTRRVPDSSFPRFASLESTSSDSTLTEHLLTLKQGDVYRFNNAGKLTRITYPTGNYAELIYDEAGYPIEYRDQLGNGGSGRTTTLLYGGSGTDRSVTEIIDPEGHRYSLGYTGKQLSSISFSSAPSSPTWSFDYYSTIDASGSFTDQPSLIRNPRGTAGGYGWTVRYLPDGRLKEVEDPAELQLLEAEGPGTAPSSRVAKMSLYFDETLAVNALRTTELTDRRGFKTLYKVNPLIHRVLEIHDPAVLAGVPGVLPVLRTFASPTMPTSVRDRWGRTTAYTYVTGTPAFYVDNLDAVTVNGTTVSRNTYTTDRMNRVATTTLYNDAGVNTTSYAYNAYGQVITVTQPNLTRPDNVVHNGVSRTFQYQGPRRQLTQITDEEGRWTQLSNFDSLSGLPQNILREGGASGEVMTYDAMGAVLTHRLPRGDVDNDDPMATTFVRDGLQRVTSVIDPAGKISTMAYDVDSNVVQSQAAAGAATTSTFDRRGFASGGSGPDGSWSRWVDAAGNERRSQDVRGFQSHATYDFAGRPAEVRTPGGSTQGGGSGGPSVHVVQYAYDSWTSPYFTDTVTELGAPANRATLTQYDARHRPWKVTAPDGVTFTETLYTNQDQVKATQVVKGTALQTCAVLTYDAWNRGISTTVQNAAYGSTPTQSSRTYTIYNKVGAVVQTVDPLGSPTAAGYAHKTTYLLDARHRVSQVVDSLGNIVKKNIYDERDLLKEVWAPDPETKSSTLVMMQRFAYTGRSEMKSAVDRLGNLSTMSFGNLPGQVLQSKDSLGRITQTDYDPQHQRPVKITEALGTADQNETQHVWTNGLPTETKVYNPATNAYTASFLRAYDQQGRLEKMDAPAMASEKYTFNDFGEIKKHNQGPKTVDHTYNSLGQTIASTWSGSSIATQTRTFDGLGRLATIDDGARRIEKTYVSHLGVPLDEIFKINGQTWKMQTHVSDVAGNLTGFVDAEAKTHEWPVDVENRPTAMKLQGTSAKDVLYTPGGLIDKEILKSSTGTAIATTTYTYDKLGRPLRSTTIQAGTNKVLSDYSYAYNAAGEVTKADQNHMASTFGFTTDARGRVKTWSTPGNGGGLQAPPFTNTLTGQPTGNQSADSTEAQARPTAVPAVPARSVAYTYDKQGNRKTEVVDGVTTTYTYNDASQLVSESSPSKTITHAYDTLGNEITQTTSITGGGSIIEAYGYNHLNLMSSYTNSATGASWQYDYWPTRERYQKSNLQTTESTQFLHRLWEAATEYKRTGTNAPALDSTYLSGLGLDARVMKLAAAGGVRKHFLGDLVGTVGSALDNGGQIVETAVRDLFGTSLAGSTALPGVAGTFDDGESGLAYVRNRYLRTRTGRFTQTDPIVANRPTEHYAYGGNNPVTMTDPMGLQGGPMISPGDTPEQKAAKMRWHATMAAQNERNWQELVNSPTFIRVQGGVRLGLGVAGMTMSALSGNSIGFVVEWDDATAGTNELFTGRRHDANINLIGQAATSLATDDPDLQRLGGNALQLAAGGGSSIWTGRQALKQSAGGTVRFVGDLPTQPSGTAGRDALSLGPGVGTADDLISKSAGFIDPHSVRFSQDSVKATFSAGGSMDDLTKALISKTVKPGDIPAIRLVQRDGLLYTLDNRRLLAFQKADVPIPYRMATAAEEAAEGWKFTTKNEGTSIRVRGIKE
jgi:RHS repeat-associated protein